MPPWSQPPVYLLNLADVIQMNNSPLTSCFLQERCQHASLFDINILQSVRQHILAFARLA